MPPSKTIQVFLSHSSKDQELVNAFIDLLHLGLGLSNEYIYCSSTPGSNSEPGDEFKKDIKANIENATIILLLTTDNFAKSLNCQIEAGAIWMNEKALTITLLLGKHASTGMLRGEIQATNILKGSDLDQLKNKILEKLLDLPKISDERWTDKKEQFLSFAKKYLRKLLFKKNRIIFFSLFFLIIILGFTAIYLSSKKKIVVVPENNFTLSLADFGDIDMKLSLRSSKNKSDTPIASNFKELLPYITEITSAKGIPKNLEITIVLPESLLKDYDSVALRMSRLLVDRTIDRSSGVPIKPDTPIFNWSSLGLDGDYEMFEQAFTDKKILIQLRIK